MYCQKNLSVSVTQMQQLTDLVLNCKRNAENEVSREERRGVVTTPERKRRREQDGAERTLKILKASTQPGKHGKSPGEQTKRASLSLCC